MFSGFKYIGNTALDLVREGYEVPFGYEEAIGFMFGDNIRDKDGVAATVSSTFPFSADSITHEYLGHLCGPCGLCAVTRKDGARISGESL